MNNKTSIIMVAFDRLQISRYITSSALGNIQMYTEPDDYELILIDNLFNEEKELIPLNDRYNIMKIDKRIEIKDIGYSASANLGVKESNQNFSYICFIHNDVFVQEGWLTKMRSFLETKKYDIVIPSQSPITRQQVKDSYIGKNERLWDDAGLMMMTREYFNKIGGWNEDFKTVLHLAAFNKRMEKVVTRIKYTNQVIITHIGAVTLNNDFDYYMKKYDEEGQLLAKL